ncbi:hypothetical protein NC99_43270 [Sunxiuqinia dokdonensis]|uniref:Uncharacterized protein n=1 Tax=Sunxiuqinia dokdonensis TaxID=1409788 RepID=A0A0L8V395_9BACT|nr:hypothetical protein NC99_43270 [Sunxiuqinia dokdonensis]
MIFDSQIEKVDDNHRIRFLNQILLWLQIYIDSKCLVN